MKLCLLGTSGSGKSTTVTLLHWKAKQLEEKDKIRYSWEATDSGMNLDGQLGRLIRGFMLFPNEPKEGARYAIMHFKFRTWLLYRRLLDIYTTDSGGGLQKELFRPLPQGIVPDENQFLEIQKRVGDIERAVYERFINTVFDSEAFLFILDADQATQQINNLKGDRQDESLSTFIMNIQKYKRKYYKYSKLKGFGLLLSKTDQIPQLATVGHAPTIDQITDFASLYLPSGWKSLISLEHEFKIQRALFYNMLHPTGEQDREKPYFKVNARNSIIYPDEQYYEIVEWLRQLVKKPYDLFNTLV
jgi:hypothetical protein